ncbi:LysR family transcriptional regulator [Bacteriovorax sp. BSW11_IV]|uniref:LysR family transcriptional regulator n=1 Tax=Bacteriovorax sp. BSW11_IV TaxID=1353529 RepID=UPI0012DF2654|nr:LysR family transcriptional regulator [Bacteriovorax sp. BSW11_IV]
MEKLIGVEMLDPHILKSFIAVAETKSFTRASRLVGLTQSTVSQQIKRLEEQMSCELILRNGKEALLTIEGEKLLIYAKRICNLINEAHDQIKFDMSHGLIRIGLPEDIAGSFIAPALAKIKAKFPKTQFSITSGLSAFLWSKFKEGDFDIVLIKQPEGETTGIASWEEPLCWIDNKQIHNYKLDPVPLVVFPSGALYRGDMIHYMDSIDLNWRISYESSSVASICSAVENGFGITLLPKRLVKKDHKILNAKNGYKSPRPYELVMHTQTSSSSLAREITKDLISALKKY